VATTISPDKKLQTLAIQRELLKCVNDYRFERRFESVSEAIRDLIVSGLVRSGSLKASPGLPTETPGPGWEAVVENSVIVGWLGPQRLTDTGKTLVKRKGVFWSDPPSEGGTE
jgi:hypothetical protein